MPTLLTDIDGVPVEEIPLTELIEIFDASGSTTEVRATVASHIGGLFVNWSRKSNADILLEQKMIYPEITLDTIERLRTISQGPNFWNMRSREGDTLNHYDGDED